MSVCSVQPPCGSPRPSPRTCARRRGSHRSCGASGMSSTRLTHAGYEPPVLPCPVACQGQHPCTALEVTGPAPAWPVCCSFAIPTCFLAKSGSWSLNRTQYKVAWGLHECSLEAGYFYASKPPTETLVCFSALISVSAPPGSSGPS